MDVRMAEIAAVLGGQAFEWLDAPVMRLGALDTPVPSAKALEALFSPKGRLMNGAVKQTSKCLLTPAKITRRGRRVKRNLLGVLGGVGAGASMLPSIKSLWAAPLPI
jgi:hypothetical protein